MTTHSEYLYPNEPTRFVAEHMDDVLAFCAQFDASDITIQTNEAIFAEIYGRLYPVTTKRLTNAEVSEMLNGIYGPNATAQILSGTDVDTYYEFTPNRFERYRYRVNGTGCQVEGHEGIQITLRSIPTTPPLLAELGLEQDIIDAYAPAEGIIYITGATGSGKSTLLASMIRNLAEDPESNRKMLTYEAPIEFVYDGIEKPSCVISQSEIPRHLPSFSAGIRNALRRKPGLILVGEARDQETIAAALEAALTGHPVYTTLHTNGVAETMRRLVTSFPSEERHGRTIDILETARLIVWQKLVPTVDEKRVALREYLVFNEEIRDRLLSANLDSVTAETRKLLKQFGQVMATDATEKFEQGIISERTYKLLVDSSHSADVDAGVDPE